jgi:hypothetical protein
MFETLVRQAAAVVTTIELIRHANFRIGIDKYGHAATSA